MTMRSQITRILQQEDINFLLTNRIPRRMLTRLMGWISRIEQPLVRDLSIAIWGFFCDLDLSEARTTRFRSMHECFTRELKPDARPIDADPMVLASPCDAIVGACGAIAGTVLLQVKGFPYTLDDLAGGPELTDLHGGGCYVTLRLTAGMYHRFHAPHDCRIERVTHIWGDTWNVNPIALRRIEKLFCKNERAVLRTRLLASGHLVTLVPVAAVLVSGIRLSFMNLPLALPGRDRRAVTCDASFAKGDEIGWFEHGSTIIVLAPAGFTLLPNVREGERIRMGQPLMRLPGLVADARPGGDL